nr:MAG TPA: tRNA-splicing ligase RtcB [Caudoviricetes sp.]
MDINKYYVKLKDPEAVFERLNSLVNLSLGAVNTIAGRLMSRKKAKEAIPMAEFEKSMSDVYSTSVCESTLDEAPQAYKPMRSIIDAIHDTVDIVKIIKPIYNFKAKD